MNFLDRGGLQYLINKLKERIDTKVDSSRVKTDVPEGAVFTDTKYTHPPTHPYSMITGTPAKLPADGGNADTVNGFTVGKNVPSDAKFTDTIVDISGKQDKLTAGDNVDINNNTISAIDTIVDISGKVDKVSGKGLSTNDFTNLDKAEVDKVKNKADKAELTAHENKKVTSIEGVHKFRVIDRRPQIENEVTGEWENVKMGTEVKVGNVLSLSVDEDDGFVVIKWQDPEDTVISAGGQDIAFAEWGGTELRFSAGNFPVDEKSGELLIDNKIKNQYKDVGFKHMGLTNDVEVYYMLFPYTKDDVYTVDSANRIAATPTEIDPNSWGGIQKIVRKGLASDFFTIGDQLMSGYDGGEIVWEVIGIDVETPADIQYQHSMTLQTRDCLHNIQFDAPEPSNTDSNRKSYGNNRYIHSAVRQWLNSSESTFNWQAQHQYDAKPTDSLELYNGAGFLHRLDPELAAALGSASKEVALNTVTDGGGQETFSDKVFLLSRVEVGLGTEGETTGEAVYPFYDGVADAARIKQLAGTNRNWWLRSPNISRSHGVRYVLTDGSVGGNGANYAYGVSPACTII